MQLELAHMPLKELTHSLLGEAPIPVTESRDVHPERADDWLQGVGQLPADPILGGLGVRLATKHCLAIEVAGRRVHKVVRHACAALDRGMALEAPASLSERAG